ncbi:hypothetical protein [Terasakiella pusilla]|uniref:hypothetical protein n=1 Tax=Terasakiella pusilla TaxID=64973 RepID=UPI003AA8B831
MIEAAIGSDEPEIEEAEGPARDEHGRFKSSREEDGTEAAPEEDPAGDGAEAASEGDDQTKEEDTQTGQVDLPQDWPDDLKAKVAAMPTDAQAAFIENTKNFQADYTRKTQAIAEERKQYEQFEQVLGPHRQAWRQAGISEAQAVHNLLAAESYLNRNPQEGLRKLAEHYGVDFSALADGQEAVNPEMAALRQELHQLRGYVTESQRTQQEQASASLVNQIETFATEKDASGNPKHPHFDTLRERMGALITAGQAKDLTDAYEQAAWLDPTVRKQMLDQQTEQQKRDEEQKRKAAVDKARKAGPSPKGTAPGNQNIPDDLDSLLKYAINKTA